MRQRGARGARGFSLLEMVLVLALVAAASLLAAAALSGGHAGWRWLECAVLV